LRKALAILIALLLLPVFPIAQGTALAAVPAVTWSDLPASTGVPLTGPWFVDLPAEITSTNLHGVVVVDEGGAGSFIPVSARWSDGRLAIEPCEPYERLGTYLLRIFLTDGTRFRKRFTAQEYPTLDTSRAEIIEVPACPELGFNYPYLLFVPPYLDNGYPHRLLVAPNNTGTSSDDLSFHMSGAMSLIQHSVARVIADRLRLPLLVPVFIRPESRWTAYTHALNRETLLIEEGHPLHRVDLQLVAMISDARALLAQNGILTKDKVFMEGFSASGKFTNRFTMLHPGLVRAVASGGVGGLPTYPVATYGGKTLRYPIGIADLEQLTGIEFNLEEYRKVAQFIHWGTADTNDPVPYRDAYEPRDAQLICSLLGDTPLERWPKSQEVYESVGASVQFATYEGIGHWYGNVEDVVRFFRANDNDRDGLTRIDLTSEPPGH